MINKYDEAFSRVDAANTAQRVYFVIKNLEQQSDKMRTRWVWELLQNAHDARSSDKNELSIEITYSGEDLEFFHNGRGFNEDEIAHLISSGSTKDETDESTRGQYGTGFLTTHLLSPEIEMSGQLEQDQWFHFTQVRRTDSYETLGISLEDAKNAFKNSISTEKPTALGDFTTHFRFPINGESAKNAVETGIETLKKSAPLILAFNRVFSRISIKYHDEMLCFQTKVRPKPDVPIQQITIMESRNGNLLEKRYFLAQNQKNTSIIAPIDSNCTNLICLPVERIPKLFWDFPLVGTESFSFPTVINSPNFTAGLDRDSIPLGAEDNDANIINRNIIEQACELLVILLNHASSKCWQHVYRWAVVPTIQNSTEETRDWLKECIKENLIDKIREAPSILNSDNKAITPKKALLPFRKKTECIETLWDLLNDLEITNERLPRRNEATGWCHAIQSWVDLYGKETSEFKELIDGSRLAKHVNKISADDAQMKTPQVNSLGLKENVVTMHWLNSLIKFLQENGWRETIRNYSIIPNQVSCLDSLGNLYRDLDIDEDLKDIAESIDWYVRRELRDSQITSLSDEKGAGDADNEFILSKLIEKLKKLAEYNSDDNKFKEASTRLFAWIVRQKDWEHLHDVPVFTKDGTVHSSLSSVTSKILLPLAPIGAWDNELQQYSDLFPPERILDDSFFEVIPDPDLWQKLCEQKFIRKNMILWYRNQSNLKDYSPEIYEHDDDGKDHKSKETFSALGIEAWDAIMDRVSESGENSRDNAYLLWRFLTEYLNPKVNAKDLEETTARCKSCEKPHKYYPSKWLKAIRSKWIRDSNSGSRLPTDASSLAKLLREKGWDLRSLQNPSTVKLLTAINVSPSDLRFELITENPEARDTLVSTMTELHQITGGDLSQVQAMIQHVQKVDGDLCQTLEVIHHMQEDENFSEYLAERQEQARRIEENQRLGTQVENLIRENLENEGFIVNPTGIGSDFEVRLNIFRNDKNWLVEVKSTRQEGDVQSVRMTSTQVQTAVKEKDKFLLCVVPLGQENTTSDVVKEKMRFIKNINESIAPLWEDLKTLKEQHANITADNISNVVLEIEEGQAGIRVNRPVWEDEGIRLEDIIKHLK